MSADEQGRRSSDLTTNVSKLDATTLRDVEERAGLQARKDRKYVVAPEVAAQLLDELRGDLLALEIDGDRSFPYSSTYYDTEDRRSYRDAATNRRRRFKVRTRTHDSGETVRLEVKTRGVRNTTQKASFDITNLQDEPSSIPPEGRRFISDELQAVGIDGRDTVDDLAPAATTSYDRSTFVQRVAQERVTIDRNLRFVSPTGSERSLQSMVIVETKTPGRAGEADRWLWRHGARPDAISKYGVAIAVFEPSLGAHKWARVLATHFDRPAHPVSP